MWLASRRACSVLKLPWVQGTGGFGLFVCAIAFYNGVVNLCNEIYGRVS